MSSMETWLTALWCALALIAFVLFSLSRRERKAYEKELLSRGAIYVRRDAVSEDCDGFEFEEDIPRTPPRSVH